VALGNHDGVMGIAFPSDENLRYTKVDEITLTNGVTHNLILIMINVCASNLRKDFFNIIKRVNDFESALIVNRQGQNLVVMSEQEYNNLIATLEILSNPVEYDKIMHPDMTDAKEYASVNEALKDLGFYDEKV
jgi:PHD/YefM family antitoxin component YafN of YafNO toxin-antitoxin module